MKEYKADALVLAVPPSVWGKIQMDPQITEGHACQMGIAIKQLATLESRFWVSLSKAPTGSIDQIGMLWEGTDNQSTRTNKQTELTVFAGGDTASRLLHMNSSDRENFYVNQLDNFYEGRFSAQKKELKFMSWPTEPWTMAGYSFPAVGEVCTKIRALNTVYNHRMVFAGEHTCLAFVGYMEGALQSGLQAAIKVNRMSLKESI